MIFPSSRPARLGQGGFTLLELLLVLFIVGLAVGLVAVNMGRGLDSSRARQDAGRLYASLRHARALALTDRVPVAVAPLVDDGAAPGDWPRAYRIERAGRRTGKVVALSRGLTLRGETVVFFPKGDSTGGVLSIRETESRGYDVEVDPVTGKPRVTRIQSD